MKILVILFSILLPLTASAQGLRDILVGAISEAGGPPGVNFGEKSNITVVNSDGGVTLVFLCSAGKESGKGDQIVDAIYDAFNGATKGSLFFLKSGIKAAISRGVVDKGDAYCSALAIRTGTRKRARNVSDGSIYTTSWRGETRVASVTDKKACRKINKRYICFEVAESPILDGDEIDGVSGCFEFLINAKLVSYSFGRGVNIADDVKATFSSANSRSNIGCVARGLGVNSY